MYSTTVIEKIKELYDRYHATSQWIIKIDSHLKLLLTREEIRAFEVQNHVNYMNITRFRCGVDLVYFVLAVKNR